MKTLCSNFVREVYKLDILDIPYIGIFSRGFNFRWVRELHVIAKNRHNEKLTLLYVIEIAKTGLTENLTQLPSGKVTFTIHLFYVYWINIYNPMIHFEVK